MPSDPSGSATIRSGGKFNHYRPAAVLLREQAVFGPMIDDATINRADRLFARLNGLLP